MGFEPLGAGNRKHAKPFVFSRQGVEIAGVLRDRRVLGSARQSRGAASVVETKWRRTAGACRGIQFGPQRGAPPSAGAACRAIEGRTLDVWAHDRR